MKSRMILAAAVAAAALGPLADMASAASNRPILVPPAGSAAQRRPGGHYSVVSAQLVRQCTDLESQFDHALAGTRGANWTHDAVALRAQGAAACSQGERQQGIEQLRAAVREIGAVPQVTY